MKFINSKLAHIIIIFFSVFIIFGFNLFSSSKIVMDHDYGKSDVYEHIKRFEYSSYMLSKGEIPLWYPFSYGGTPFLAIFEPAVFYPIHYAVSELFPLLAAINILYAIHLFMFALFMYLWFLEKNIRGYVAVIMAVHALFISQLFMRLGAGHINTIYAISWIPLIFLCLDKLIKKSDLKFFLALTAAISMQIFSGNPQYTYYTCLIVVVYLVLNAPLKMIFRILITVFLSYLFAALICAVQILPFISSFAESFRGASVDLSVADKLCFPFNGFFSMFVPDFYGPLIFLKSSGKFFFVWEINFYIGIAVFFLIILSMGYHYTRYKRNLLIISFIAFLIALGGQTPVYRIMYDFFPFFDSFRGPVKLLIFAQIFLLMIAALGVENILKSNKKYGKFVLISSFIGILCLFFSGQIVRVMFDAGNVAYLFGEDAFTACLSSFRFFIVLFLTCCSIIYYIGKNKKFVLLLLAVSVISGYFYIFKYITFTDYDYVQSDFKKQLKESVEKRAFENILGKFPNISKRYSDFLVYLNPKKGNSYVLSSEIELTGSEAENNFLKLLRASDREKVFPAMLIYDYCIKEQKDGIFEILADENFDLTQTVILEQKPEIDIDETVDSQDNKIELINYSEQYADINVNINTDAIILFTDSYSKDWQAKGTKDGKNEEYKVLPANYILKALPVKKGRHEIKLYYSPKYFSLSKVISASFAIVYLLMLMYAFGVIKIRCKC